MNMPIKPAMHHILYLLEWDPYMKAIEMFAVHIGKLVANSSNTTRKIQIVYSD